MNRGWIQIFLTSQINTGVQNYELEIIIIIIFIIIRKGPAMQGRERAINIVSDRRPQPQNASQ